MAAKDITDLSYAELMKHAHLFSGIPKDKKLIDINEFNKFQKHDMRINVLDWDTIFDDYFKYILMLRFSKKDKDVKKLFEPSIGGPLVSLIHKARLAYALKIIDKTALNDFENIHNIRNKFAHNAEMNFDNTEVLKLVKKLSTAKGKKVTAKNSYECFSSVTSKCVKCLKEASQQEFYRLAAIKSLKEQEAKGD